MQGTLAQNLSITQRRDVKLDLDSLIEDNPCLTTQQLAAGQGLG